LGLGYRLFRVQRGPRVGAEVVAAEHDPRRVEADLGGDAVDECDEVGRGHAGVAAVLVDLVAGRLEQDEGQAGALRMAQRGLDDDGVGRADRGHAAGDALLVARDQVLENVHGKRTSGEGNGGQGDCGGASCSGSRASSRDATRASARPTSFSGPGTTPAKSRDTAAVTSGPPQLLSGATTIALP